MNYKVMICTLLLALSLTTAKADGEREKVEAGIAQVERMAEARQWHEAFLKLRQVETTDATSDALRYLTTKKRYQMYDRLHKSGDAKDCMARMESLATRSGDLATIEDMLIEKADFNQKQGNSGVARDCYLRVFENRAKGKDDTGREQCFQSMIAEAKQKGIVSMENVISGLYTAWQDSISAVRAAEEIVVLKDSCAAAQNEIAERKSTISYQYTFIVVLALIIAAAAIGLVILFLMLVRGRSVTKKLRNQLSVSETNSEQKSHFIRNIGKQLTPSLTQIAAGNTQQVTSLQNMLSDVERFLAIEEDKSTSYETTSYDVSKLCEEVCAGYTSSRVSVTSDATRLQFPVCVDTVKQILGGLIDESLAQAGTERIVIGFHKRNPHTGQFTVTVNGMKLETEDTASLFVPFAKVYDLAVSTGLALPICGLLTSKMNGAISVDSSFTKGTKFVVEVHG